MSDKGFIIIILPYFQTKNTINIFLFSFFNSSKTSHKFLVLFKDSFYISPYLLYQLRSLL